MKPQGVNDLDTRSIKKQLVWINRIFSDKVKDLKCDERLGAVFMPVILAPWEAEVGGLLQARSLRTT